MDVERVAAERLSAATGVRAVLEVPDERPEEFISVELVGSSGRWVRTCELAVQSWAATRRRAAQIAQAVEAAAPSIAREQNVFDSVAGSTYRFPDPDSGQARYQTNVTVTVCE